MLIASTPVEGAQNTSTVMTPKGIAARRMKGMRRPSGLSRESDLDAMKGSMKPSSRRPHAVMMPMTVRPANTTPCVMKSCMPWETNSALGM